MKHLLALFALLFVTTEDLEGAARRRAVRFPATPWSIPQCGQVTGGRCGNAQHFRTGVGPNQRGLPNEGVPACS